MAKSAVAKRFLHYAAPALMGLAAAGCSASAQPPKAAFNAVKEPLVSDLTPQNFGDKVFGAPGLVIVDFRADWCAPCVTLKPVIEEIAQARKRDIKVVALDLTNQEDEGRKNFGRMLNKEYGLNIAILPSMVAFKNGEVVSKLERTKTDPVLTRENITAWIDRALESAKAMPSPPLTMRGMPERATDETFFPDVLGSKGLVLVSLCSDKIPACRDLGLDRIARRESGRMRTLSVDLEEGLAVARYLRAMNENGEIKLPSLHMFKDGKSVASFEAEPLWWRTAMLVEKIADAVGAGQGPQPGLFDKPPQDAFLMIPGRKP